MKKLILSLMSLTLVVTVMAQSEATRTAYNTGVEAWGAKNFTAAAAAFEDVIKKGMDEDGAAPLVATAKNSLPTCYRQIAIAQASAKNFDAALASLTKSIQYAELYDAIADISKAKNIMGKIYQSQGGSAFNAKNYAAAVPIFEKGIAADPRNTEMTNWLGICYCEMGDLQKGMSYFTKIVEMGAANPRYAAAAAKATKNIELYVNNQVAELQKAKNYDGVIAMANSMLEANPANATAAFIRLQAYMDKKDYNKVIELGEGAAAVQSTTEDKSNIYFVIGAAYNAKDNKAQALAILKKVTAGDKVAGAKATIKELEEAMAQ